MPTPILRPCRHTGRKAAGALVELRESAAQAARKVGVDRLGADTALRRSTLRKAATRHALCSLPIYYE